MFIVLLQAGGSQLTLVVRDAAPAGPPPLVRALGYDWTYLERQPARALIALLRGLEGLVAAGSPSLPPQQALDRAGEHLRRSAPDTRLVFLRRLEPAQVIPWWPMSLCNGALSTGALCTGALWDGAAQEGALWDGALWPSDVELLGVRLGLRTLVKRETADDEEAQRSLDWLAAGGLRAVRGGREGRVVLAAQAEETVLRAVDAEAALRTGGAAGDEASRWLGRALGYPSCCVEAFLSLGRRDDLSLYATRLAPLGSPAARPETLWLPVPLRLLTYTPCSPDCPASLALAERLLAGLDAAAPGYRARWLEQARRVHLVTLRGEVLALQADGPLDGARITHGLRYESPPDLLSLPAVSEVPELVGATLAVQGDELRVGPYAALLAADHRGLGSWHRSRGEVSRDRGSLPSTTKAQNH